LPGEHAAASWRVGGRPWRGWRSAWLRVRASIALLAVLAVAHGR